MILMTIDVVIGKWNRKLPLGLSYLISPGSSDNADDWSFGWSLLLETYDTSPSANMMMPVVRRKAVILMPQRNLGLCQCVKLGIDCVDRWLDDCTYAGNREHSVH
jgi:hypothetical protein